MKTMKTGVALAIAISGLTLIGCPEKKGPVQKAGEAVDDAAEKVGDAIDPKGPAEKVGREIDKAVDD